MKKKLITFITIVLICFGVTYPVNAQGFNKSAEIKPISSTSEQGTSYGTFALKIEYKYRYYNGRYQYRRWNVSLGCWVDPYWIDC